MRQKREAKKKDPGRIQFILNEIRKNLKESNMHSLGFRLTLTES